MADSRRVLSRSHQKDWDNKRSQRETDRALDAVDQDVGPLSNLAKRRLVATSSSPHGYSSTSWADISTVVSFDKKLEKGISLSNSTIKFLQPGLYVMFFTSAVNPGASRFLATRLQRRESTIDSHVCEFDGQSQYTHIAVFQAGQNEEIALQYAVDNTHTGVGTVTVNGKATKTVKLIVALLREDQEDASTDPAD